MEQLKIQAKPLLRERINNGFAGWNREAQINKPEDGFVFTLSAFETPGIHLLHSPSGNSDFFCLEPISRLVNIHDLMKVAGALLSLKPGECLTGAMWMD